MSCPRSSSKVSPLPENDLTLLTEAAREAGRVALRHWKRTSDIRHKPDGAGPVTAADLEVDGLLREMLTSARPGYGWLSEETPDDSRRLAAERVFIVDPIDGTRAFIAHERDFAHSLAVAERGRIVAGVVYLPAREALYAATADGPATLNGAPQQVAGRHELRGATLLAQRSTLAPGHWRQGQVPPIRHRFRASMAWRLCLVAEGRFDAMMTLRPAWEWDIAAGALIARQAGATVSDRFGAAIRFNAPDPRAPGVIAAAPAVWGALRAALAE